MDQRTNELNTGGVYPAAGTRSSEQIRADIELRRAEMEVLATCLRDKLSPHAIADEVKRGLQSRGTRVASSLATSVRDNPKPWLVIAGGLAWLIKETRDRSNRDASLGFGTSTYGPVYGPTYGSSMGASGRSVGLSSSGLGSPTPYAEPAGFATGGGFSE